MTYRINEIFYSLQGEGCLTGTPAVFVRFSGCNLKCDFCDTDFLAFTEMTADDIAHAVLSLLRQNNLIDDDWHSESRLSALKNPILVLTGGEPTLQVTEELLEVLHRIIDFITIETNGTRPIPLGIDWITCSPKLHLDGELTQDKIRHNLRAQAIDELKVVYTGADISAYLSICANHYYLQPCSQKNTDAVIQYILKNPQWSLSLQTHKYLKLP